MSTSSYADLEIRILKREAPGYPVEITFNGDQEFPRGHLSPALPAVDLDVPRQTGEALFAWLFHETRLAAAWAEARGQRSQRRIRLRIDDTAPELHALPWETLRDPKSDYLAALDSTPFSRYLAAPSIPGSPILGRPIRMLVAIASPKHLTDFEFPGIDADIEWEALQKTLAAVPNLKLIRLTGPCDLSTLEKEVRSGVHILHFIGHGSFEDGKASLVLADDSNKYRPTPGDEFAEMLGRLLREADANSDDKLRLVYLSSCQTAARDTANAYKGLAPMLVQAGVPAVIGMQDNVHVTTARSFSKTFYSQLMTHGEVDRAANAARSAALTAELPGAAIPVLFLRLRSAQLFGQRGAILGSRAESFWETLIGNIREKECTPFLGPGVTAGLLPSSEELAAALASKFNYPFPNNADLPRVTQFVGTIDDRRLRKQVISVLVSQYHRRMGFAPNTSASTLSEAIEKSNWAERSEQVFETEIHRQLAAFELPLYLTTNCDNFMTLALQAKGRTARRTSIPWRSPVLERWGLDPAPSPDHPVVLHLFGTDEDLKTLVLTEDDHLDYLASISHDHQFFLPYNVFDRLAETTLLFLGYRLQDLDLKILMRGLLSHLDLNKWRMLHVAVQLESLPGNAAAEKEVMDFFQKSFSNLHIDIYWGTTQQFLADLSNRWREYSHG